MTELAPTDQPQPQNDAIFCSFCGKNRNEVALVVSGPVLPSGMPTVCICSECLEFALVGIAENMKVPPEAVYGRLRELRFDRHRKLLERMKALVHTDEVVEVGVAKPVSQE